MHEKKRPLSLIPRPIWQALFLFLIAKTSVPDAKNVLVAFEVLLIQAKHNTPLLAKLKLKINSWSVSKEKLEWLKLKTYAENITPAMLSSHSEQSKIPSIKSLIIFLEKPPIALPQSQKEIKEEFVKIQILASCFVIPLFVLNGISFNTEEVNQVVLQPEEITTCIEIDVDMKKINLGKDEKLPLRCTRKAKNEKKLENAPPDTLINNFQDSLIKAPDVGIANNKYKEEENEDDTTSEEATNSNENNLGKPVGDR